MVCAMWEALLQVATGENWNDTMVHAVAATGWAAAVYFVVVRAAPPRLIGR